MIRSARLVVGLVGLGVAVAAMVGCGDGGDGSSQKSASTSARQPGAVSSAAKSVTVPPGVPEEARRRLERNLKRGASARDLSPRVRSRVSREARAVCADHTPERLVAVSLPAARRRVTDANERRLLRTAAHPPKLVRTSSAYTGVAARVYALSLPEPERAVATQACATQLITKESK